MRASQVAHYLDASKTLSGNPLWMTGTRRGQLRLKWPVLFQDASDTHIEICASTMAPFPKYSITLQVPPPIARLDIDEMGLHANRHTEPRQIMSHHYHPWDLNKPRQSEKLPAKLSEAVPYSGPIGMQAALDWFCQEMGIASLSLPPMPGRDLLL